MQGAFKGKNVYLVGIKGAGMTGLAQILKGLGYNVSGSDITDRFFTDDILRRAGIEYREGFSVKNIPKNVDWAVSSGAYYAPTNDQRPTTNNSEIEELKKRRVPVMSYPEALGYFFNQAYGIAVTGTHGKSTTAAMIAYVLEQAGKDLFALIGGELLNWRSNARIPKSPKRSTLNAKSFFVIEADEYREQFLHYTPNVLVITNIDYDHSDYFATKESYRKAFEKFKKQVKKDGIVIERKEGGKQESAGTLPPQHCPPAGGQSVRPHDSCTIVSPQKELELPLGLIGEHNQRNAWLAYQACKELGVKDSIIKKSLAKFKGLRRRLETIGEYNGALIIDDYAHHPAEVEASLYAMKHSHLFPRSWEKMGKLIVLFHPHTYSRTEKFLKGFAKALTVADEIYLLDIYASAREKRGDVSSNDIIQGIQALGRDAINLHTIENAVKYFQTRLKRGDIFVAMGAGDVFRVAYRLLEKIKS